MKAKDLKMVVKEKYGEIASNSKNESKNEPSCCVSSGHCDSAIYTSFSDDYSQLEGYNSQADLGLGCGLPTEFAGIKVGDSVLDLGSGAGNDAFIAAKLVSEMGEVTGLDFTEAMVNKARENLSKTGFKNIEFLQGDIENMPLGDCKYNVVISNCVLNLVPDKRKAFSEIFRILRPGGHFCISDVVLKGILPEKLREEAELYAGCVSGALQKDAYIDIMKEQGFSDIIIHKEKQIDLPEEVLASYLSENELRNINKGEIGVFSITVTGVR